VAMIFRRHSFLSLSVSFCSLRAALGLWQSHDGRRNRNLRTRRSSEPVPRLSVPTLREIMNIDLHSVSFPPGTGRSPLSLCENACSVSRLDGSQAASYLWRHDHVFSTVRLERGFTVRRRQSHSRCSEREPAISLSVKFERQGRLAPVADLYR
jgi:hypothetical protein